MATVSLEEIRQDRLAMSVASALALANEAAIEQGVEPEQSLVTISEEPTAVNRTWRIHYGPRDYIHQRGGDLIVLIDAQTCAVLRIIHGQ